MSAGLFKSRRISIPLFIFVVLIVVACFLMQPGVSAGSIEPLVTTGQATNITANSATLSGSVSYVVGIFPDRQVFAFALPNAGFDWGTSQGGPYSNSTPAGYTSDTAFSAILTNLTAFTTYYYKAYVIDTITQCPGNHAVFANGSPVRTYGTERSFTTTGNQPSNNLLNSDGGAVMGSGPNVGTGNVNIVPLVASANQQVTVYANVVNRGDLEGGFTINLKVNGQIEQTQTGIVAGNTAVPLEFTIVKDVPGTYNIDVGGKTAFFTVVASQQNNNSLSQSQMIFIAVAVLVIAAIGLITALILRRRAGY
jgi:hypothetical protein